MNRYIIPVKNGMYCMLIGLCFTGAGCKKFADVDAPNNQLSSANVFTNNATLKSAIAGMYSTMAVTSSYDIQTGLTSYTGMSADEMTYSGGTSYDGFIYNAIPVNDINVATLWASFYKTIYQANSIIEGVQNSAAGALTDSLKDDAIAECKFLRAFCHFYLTNIWGDIPVVTTTNAATNNSISRSGKETVYSQILTDLTAAKDALRKDYAYAGGERTRANRFAAMAMLARVNLYTGNWAAAAAYADSVISSSSLYTLLGASTMSGIFVKNNTEAILQLYSAGRVGFTDEGNIFLLSTTIPNFQIAPGLISSFETGDRRYTNWVGKQVYNTVTYYFPYKYKLKAANTTTSAEYVTYLRLAEQYLVRAEARNELNNLSGALADINVIRTRAGLANSTAATKDDLKLAIEKERRTELFAEYGHRWLDLKRTNRADAVLGATKTGWSSTDALYPIPQVDAINNQNLGQNAGYN